MHLPDLPGWLIGVLALVLVLRIPSFFEPYYYGDEMVYLTLGQGIHQGLTLYKDIFDNKPPLLYLAAAAAGNLFWFKVILAFWNLATIVIFWNLSKIVFEKLSKSAATGEKLQKASTVIFALLTTLPLLEGNIANAELFLIGPSLLAFYILLGKAGSLKNTFAAGFLLGIATLFKVPAIFEAPVIPIFWLITEGWGSWKEIVKKTFYLFLGFITPIVLSFVWYFLSGALSEYIRAAFFQNLGYLSSFRPQDVHKSFIARNAPLLTRAALVVLGLGVLTFFRNKISKKFLFASIWVLLSLFAVTLSERPYPHYLIQSVAPISILLAMLIFEKSVEQAFTVIPLALCFFIPVYYKFYYYQTGAYYLRFAKFAAGQIGRELYFNSFSPSTTRDYKIADFLTTSSKPTDKVFMWDGDSPAVYSLARRLPPIKYVVPYHVNDYSDKATLIKSLISLKPKFIILTSGSPLPEISPLIKSHYILITQIENASIWSRISLDQK